LPNVEITNNGEYGTSWIFKDKGAVQVGSGDIQMNQDGIVKFLSLGNATEYELTLIQVIEKYAEPSLVSPYYCREGLCDAIIIYPELGMALRIFAEDTGEGDRHSIYVASDTVVKYVVFFSTNSKDKNLGGFVDNGLFEDFVSWKGYGVYP